MKRVANKHLLQRKYINKDNFEWEFYLKNNNDLFEELDKNNYNKDWAWNHWINNGNKMNWRRPVIKLTDNIDYTEICDEFKHFNGGELIWNYVKTDMFTDLPKLEGSEFNIGIIGILPKIKRPDIALDIIENLIKKDSRYKLVILGKRYTDWIGTSKHKKEIEYYKKLEERINSSELKNHIVFDKFTPEVDKWFQKIGFILSVSDIEGSHQSVAEAMATGTIPLIYGKALTDYKLDEVYPKKYCFYEDTVDKLCDKIYLYSNNKEEKCVISGECKKHSNFNFKLKDIYNQYSKMIINKLL
jgi:glycosyltransferase involved in cell wall biosynthesis